MTFRVLCIHIVLALSCITLPAGRLIAQGQKQPVYIYAEAGGGFGSITQLNGELNCLFLNHHQLSVGYAAYSQKADVPADYNGSGLLGTTTPLNYLDGVTISYAYVLYPRNYASNDRLRYTIKAGLLSGTYSEPGNYHHTNLLFGPNYKYDDIAERSIAFIIRPGITYAPSRVFGLSFGLYAVMGKLGGAGVWGSMSLGKVGSHIRHHKKKDEH